MATGTLTRTSAVVPLAIAPGLAEAGGKGANLGLLMRAGLPVPDGFVLTTGAYRDAAGPLVDGLVEAGADAARIRSAIGALEVPEPVRGAVLAAYRALGGGAVAVRSSATAEDLPDAAFAGQQDTLLGVRGEAALLRAVVDCWASLWSDRAADYRRRRGVPADGLAIAVVVQRMVEAESAGVLFTADPVSGRRDRMVVDAARGLGESVVAGLVTPEHLVLDRRGRLLERSAADQREALETDAAGGVRTVASASGPVLGAADRRRLAELGRRVEALFGAPQDVEWAVAGGALHLLQARPMTALPPEPVRLSLVQRTIGPFYLEMFAVRPTPLDVSGWMQRGVFTMLGRMAGSVGVAFPPLGALVREEDGVMTALTPPLPRPTAAVLRAPASLARRARRFDAARWEADPRFAAFLAEKAALVAEPLAGRPWAEVLGVVHRSLALVGHVTDLRVDYLPSAFLPVGRLQVLLTLTGRRRLAGALLAGAPTRTLAANRALEGLAALVRAHEDLRRAFGTVPAADLVGRIREPDAAAFAAAFDAVLAEYGHRETVSPLLSSAPTWSAAPEAVLGLVQVLVPEATTPAGASAASALGPREALAVLTATPVLRPVRRRVDRLVGRARSGIAFREDSHFWFTAALPPLRRALLELGDRLARAGALASADDVWHLRLEELEALPDDALLPAEVDRIRSLADRRARLRARLGSTPLLDLAPPRSVRGALLTGVGASRGTAEGPVRVVGGPADFGRLRPGEVLVCRYTNPAWTPLFARAAAVVVDAGGLGSHAAIVAREYGIPAVMGVRDGTARLTDGQRVVVDGSAGTVRAA